MTRWILRLLSRREIRDAVALARHHNRLGVACARKSHDYSARQCRQIRDARMWEARGLAMRPSKRRTCPVPGADRVNHNVSH